MPFYSRATRLYTSLCQSVGLLVRQSVGPSHMLFLSFFDNFVSNYVHSVIKSIQSEIKQSIVTAPTRNWCRVYGLVFMDQDSFPNDFFVKSLVFRCLNELGMDALEKENGLFFLSE